MNEPSRAEVYPPWLWAMAYQRARIWPDLKPEVDDLVQETVICCVRQQIDLARPSGLIAAILYRRAVDLLRKRLGRKITPGQNLRWNLRGVCACGAPRSTHAQRCSVCEQARVARARFQPRTCSMPGCSASIHRWPSANRSGLCKPHAQAARRERERGA